MKSLRYVLVSLLVAGCGGSHGGSGSVDMGPPGPPALAMPCSDSGSDLYTLPASLGTYTSANRGDVFRCVPGEQLSPTQVNTYLKSYGYTGSELPSGFWVWRVAYRTERAKPASVTGPVEGDTAAFLLVPDHPIADAPLVVFAHGSVGIADNCAPTLTDLSKQTSAAAAPGFDFGTELLTLAGYGYTVIAPDYPGFAFGQPPGYFSAADEAHAVLDATRAAGHLLTAPPSKVAVVGHSQGGHAAFATQVYADAGTYGAQGTIVGIAAFAPLWASMSIWGAISSSIGGAEYPTSNPDNASPILYTMEYFYSAGELYDGAGHGGDVFANPSAATQVLRGGICYDSAGLAMLGDSSNTVFNSSFAMDVGDTCAIGGDCSSALSTTWKARWDADRPPVDPNGPPLLVWFGGKDTFVSPGLAQCIEDKVQQEGASGITTYCVDANADHHQVVRGAGADYVNKWISFKAGIGADPGACTAPTPTMCIDPPNNDL